MDVDAIAQFCDITGSSWEHAESMLQSSNGELEVALAQHFAIQEVQGESGGAAMEEGAVGEEAAAAAALPAEDVEEEALPQALRPRIARRNPRRRRTQRASARHASPPLTSSDPMASGEGESMADSDSAIAGSVEAPEAWPVFEAVAPMGTDRLSGTEGFADEVGDIDGEYEALAHPRPALPRRIAVPPAADSLDALFAPPAELLYRGAFPQACERALESKRWVLVNIQREGDFPSMVLNRDVWRDSNVRVVVESFFVLWQQPETSPMARDYVQYYQVQTLPHVAVVDPRTGERLRVWEDQRLRSLSAAPARSVGEIDRDGFLSELLAFVESNSLEDASPRPPPTRGAGELAASTSSGAGRADEVNGGGDMGTPVANAEFASGGSSEAGALESAVQALLDDDRPHLSDRRRSQLASLLDPQLAEERRLRAVQDAEMEASMAADRAREQHEAAREEDQRREVAKAEEQRQRQQQEEQERQQRREQMRQELPSEPAPDEPAVAVAVRLPHGERLARRFRPTDRLCDLFAYIELHSELHPDRFTLMETFPKPRTFAPSSATLADSGIDHRATLFVHETE
ncbi:hypothetical protein CDCA_CDCA02G0546 [Cyanidium caldarium]|uniref:UBX domain-containing protein n=1 Tax=Cyanidium caldarium TaxID=2771 RepID=A0AAV9IR23_CYACA|nr:hypothetical protein CDCA_CDCA02G0546 [Cyanidium caldarium]